MVLGILVIVRIALPYALESAVPRFAANQNLRAEVGNIDLGLIAGEVTLEDVVVDILPPEGGADASVADSAAASLEPLLELDRLHVAFEWTALLARRIHLTELELDHPVVVVVQRADGRLRLPELPSDPADEESEVVEASETPADEESPGWAFALDRFELNTPLASLRTHASHEEVVHLAAEQLGFDALVVDGNGVGLGGIDLVSPELFVQREWVLDLGNTPPTADPEDGDAAIAMDPESAGAPLASEAGATEAAATDPALREAEAEVEVAADAEDGRATAAEEMLAVNLESLTIERAAFTVDTDDGPVEVALHLELTDAGTGRDQDFPIDLGIQIDEATIALKGRLGLNPLSFEGDLDWKGLRVPPFLQLGQPALVPWLASCDANGHIEIDFDSTTASKPGRIRIAGSTNIVDLSFRQPETKELALAWESLDIELRELVIPLEAEPESPIRVDVSRVALTAPVVVYTNPPDAFEELMEAVGGGAASAEEPGADAASDEGDGSTGPEPQLTIDQVELTNGTIRYVDRSVRPVHETKIHALHVVLDAVSNLPAPGAEKVAVEGRIQSAGTFSLEGGLPGGRGTLDFSLRKLDLVSYDSLARGAGWQIDRGQSSLTSAIESTGQGYQTKNELVLHDLRVDTKEGNDFASQFGVSLDVALALLRDPKGDIAIAAPISIDDTGAGVDLAPVIASALRTVLQGALTSPIKMLGMVVPEGDDSGASGAIPFRPGEDRPRTDARVQLETLAEFVQTRPALALTIDGRWSEADREPTARSMLQEAAVEGGDFPEVEGVGIFQRRRVAAALRDRAEGGSGSLEPDDASILERYVDAQEVPESRLRKLAEARAEAVRTTLLELEVPEEALALGSPSESRQPGVAVELGARSE